MSDKSFVAIILSSSLSLAANSSEGIKYDLNRSLVGKSLSQPTDQSQPTPAIDWQNIQLKSIEKRVKPLDPKQIFKNRIKLSGTESGGGGGPEEADFVSTAWSFYRTLAEHKDISERALGIDLNDLLATIEYTQVQCAVGENLEKMKKAKKKAYFIPIQEGIFLDCENYSELNKSYVLKNVVMFHEYMRTLGKENSNYKVSSKLPDLLAQIISANATNALPACRIVNLDNGREFRIYLSKEVFQKFDGLSTDQNTLFKEISFALMDLKQKNICQGRYEMPLTGILNRSWK